MGTVSVVDQAVSDLRKQLAYVQDVLKGQPSYKIQVVVRMLKYGADDLNRMIVKNEIGNLLENGPPAANRAKVILSQML